MTIDSFCIECKYKDEICFRPKRNDEIQLCFVETADRDYIISRALFRMGFKEESLYHTSQALEKYLKALLLYDNCDIRNDRVYGHHLGNLKGYVNEKVESDVDLQFVVKNIEYSFYNVIENYTDRYGIIMAPEIDFLSLLDKAIFRLRPYCRDIDFESKIRNISRKDLLQEIPMNTNIGGYLELVLTSSGDSRYDFVIQKEILCWKNKYAPADGSSSYFRNNQIARKMGDQIEGLLCKTNLGKWRDWIVSFK